MATLEIVKTKLEAMHDAEEYFNALSTNIQLSGSDIKVVAISSVQPNEGKSTISTNLATAFARAGYRTLLIDADIRNSIMTGIFRSQGRVAGLTEVLSGKDELTQAIATTDYPKLDVLLSGQISPNPTGLLQSKNFEIIMNALRNHYDYIIVDTPPIGMVIDAAIITQKCDASILVTAAGETKRRDVLKAKEQLEQTGTPFLGVVLNKFNTEVEKYGAYGGYGAYGAYGSYGNYGKKK